MKLGLRAKIYGLAALAGVLPVLVALLLLARFQGRVSADAGRELTTLAKLNITQTVRDIYGLCETVNDLAQKQVNHDLSLSLHILAQRGQLSLNAPEVSWAAVNQLTLQTQAISLPRLLMGGQWLGQTRDPRVFVPLIDDTGQLVGCTISVFQRMNEQGDMLRVASNVPDANGQRGIGTYVPAMQPDGTPNPVVAATLRGQAYRGAAFGITAWFVTAYEPLRDSSGKVIGMIGVGEKLTGLAPLQRAIRSTRIGRSGTVSILGCTGDQRGRSIIASDSTRDGESRWETRDASGRLLVQEEILKAMALPRGDVLVDAYPWQNRGESSSREKLAAIMYFAPWDWLIDANIYQDEYLASADSVGDSVRALMIKATLGGFLMLALALTLAFWMGNRLSRPLRVVAQLAGKIAAGDVQTAKTAIASAASGRGRFDFADESEELLEAFRGMTLTLDELIGQVQRSGIQVTSSATEIAAGARQLEATVAEQAASTREVSATSSQISATSAELLLTMSGVSRTVSKAAACAETGHAELGGMETSMRQLARSTSSISSRLGVISERANKISTVVTTINAISDQTALLSLNAAIEAEKAGEFGKGFSVVAREISRLADQTALATQYIDGVVREMQSSVSSGVMEMDKFSEEVRRRVEEMSGIAAQLGRIIDQVKALGLTFETAQQGVNAQTQGAHRISEAMSQLAQTADQTRESLNEFKGATGQLDAAVRGMQGQVLQFKTGA